jgi:hypothetical protein
LQRFGYFDTRYCSKNFAFTKDKLDGHITDYVIDQDIFYRKFFIANNSDTFFNTINSFGHVQCNHKQNIYNLESKITNDFDLYIVDGPFGSPRFSRYDIVFLVERFQKDKDFVILFDDTNRVGEKDTLKEILLKLKNKNIKYHVGHYEGNKRVTLICTEKYIYLTSL